MDGYNFWQDFLDTYQSLSDVVKALWLLVPPAFALALTAAVLRYRLALAKWDAERPDGEPLYTICRDPLGRLHVYAHRPESGLPHVLLLERSIGERTNLPAEAAPE